jgi:hypothetical protein
MRFADRRSHCQVLRHLVSFLGFREVGVRCSLESKARLIVHVFE